MNRFVVVVAVALAAVTGAAMAETAETGWWQMSGKTYECHPAGESDRELVGAGPLGLRNFLRTDPKSSFESLTTFPKGSAHATAVTVTGSINGHRMDFWFFRSYSDCETRARRELEAVSDPAAARSALGDCVYTHAINRPAGEQIHAATSGCHAEWLRLFHACQYSGFGRDYCLHLTGQAVDHFISGH
jgi:hypothetical protein